MPISDEVIELAPVSKTKKKLIIIFIAMGLCIALAATFLVLYLLKPSVTEDSTVVKGVNVTASELFTTVENGEEVRYASVGNEYIIYATISVEKGASPNIMWDWTPHEALQIVESTEVGASEGENAYIKFIPRAGFSGTEVTVKARSQSNVNKSESVKFKIIKQGAEDISVTEYGVQETSGVKVLGTFDGDTHDKTLKISGIPYYTAVNSTNNKRYVIRFKQLGKYNETTQEYLDITTLDKADSVKVEVSGETGVLHTDATNGVKFGKQSDGIYAVSFAAAKAGKAVITLTANVNNDDAPNIQKTIEIEVKTNTDLGYSDNIYFFNKAVVDADFIKDCLTSGNNTSVDKKKIEEKLKADPTLKIVSVSDVGGFLTLPFTRSKSYNDIYKHILVNPVNIQYNAGTNSIKENWYSSFKVSSDGKHLRATTAGGVTKLEPLSLAYTPADANERLPEGAADCYLTVTDVKPGSAGTEIKVPVRIVAPNSGAQSSVGSTKETDGAISVPAVPGGSYEFTVVYDITALGTEKVETLLPYKYINNKFRLEYDTDELEITAKGGKKILEPNKDLEIEEFVFDAGTGNTEKKYNATATFTVKVKNVSEGPYSFKFVKTGVSVSGMPQSGTDIDDIDRSWQKTVTFNVTQKAASAGFVTAEAGRRYITSGGTEAGDFVLGTAQESKHAYAYVQNKGKGVQLELSKADGVKNLIAVYSASDQVLTEYNVSVSCTVLRSDYVTLSGGILSFAGKKEKPPVTDCATVTVTVLDGNDKVDELVLHVRVIDAVIGFEPIADQKQVLYSGSDAAASVMVINENLVKVIRAFNTEPTLYYSAYSGIDIYYGYSIDPNCKLERVNTETGYTYKHEGTVLYAYNKNSKQLSAQTDIYAYSLAKSIDFSHICLEFVIGDTDEFIGKHDGEVFTDNATAKCTFTRKADGVALFTDPQYLNEIDPDNEVFEYSVNQGKPVDLYASATVTIAGQADPVIVKTTRGIIAVEQAYIAFNTVNGSDFKDLTGTPCDITNGYGDLHFTAPSVSAAADGGIKHYNNVFTVKVIGNAAVEKQLYLTVRNVARGIQNIELFDATGNTLSDALVFGGFINASTQYSHTVRVKLTYKPAQENYSYFESAIVECPSYLTLELVTGITFDENTGKYTITPDASKIKDENVVAEYTCKFTLREHCGGHDGGEDDKITVMQEHNVTGRVSVTENVCVNTGLGSIEITGDGISKITVDPNHNGDLDYLFRLNDLNDIRSLKLNLNYIALADLKYDIAFDYKHADKFTVTYPSAGSGLTVEGGAKNASEPPSITIKIKDGDVRTMSGVKLTFVFTDTFNGTSENNTFTLNVTISVEMDVYALGFGDEGNSYAVTTTGEATGSQAKDVALVYNNNNALVQPKDDVKSTVDVFIVKDGSRYAGNDVRIGVDGKLYVDNGVLNGSGFAVRAEYKVGGTVKAYAERPVEITTSALGIRLDSDADVVNGKIKTTVTSKNNTLGLAAEVYNKGTDGRIDAETRNIVYKLYNNADCADEHEITTGSSVDEFGTVTFVPSAPKGTVWYKAGYGDESIVIEIEYTAAAESAALDGIDGFTLDGEIITLYFIDKNNYTYIDLADYIKAVSSFSGVTLTADSKTVTLSSQTNAVTVNGTVITPNAVTAESGVQITVTAGYLGTSASKTYTVSVKAIDALKLNTSEYKGTIDIVKNDSVTVSPLITQVDGFDGTYTLTADAYADRFVVSGDGNDKVISLNGRTNEHIGGYYFTAKVVYTGKNDSSAQIRGELQSSLRYTLTVVCRYDELDFDFTHNGTELDTYVDGDNDTKHILGNDTSGYALVVKNNVDGAVYKFTASANSVISIDADNSVSVVANRSGSFDITLKATVYGKEFTQTKKYYFAYGTDPSVSVYGSSDGGNSFGNVIADKSVIDVGYTVNRYILKYVIGNVDTATVEVSDISLNVVGGTKGDVIKDGSSYYVLITADRPGMLHIGGTVTLGNRTVYLSQVSYTLEAFAPEFEITADISEILPSGSVALTFAQTSGKFKGDYKTGSPSISVLSGGEYVTLTATDFDTLCRATLTAKPNIINDITVTVGVSVEVLNGVYGGIYNIEKTVVIKGVKLPDIEWKASAADTVSVGGEGNSYTSGDYTFANPEGYDYSGKVTYSVSADSVSLVKGTDYTFENNKLVVLSTSDKAKAGGKITLTVTAKVTSGAHSGESVSDTLVVTVLPELNVPEQALSLPNAKGTVDFNSAEFVGGATRVISPYYNTGSEFVNADDKYSVVSLEITGSYDSAAFGTDGGKLIIKKNIESPVTLDLYVGVLISDGAYAGYRLYGTLRVTVEVPQSAAPLNVTWNGTAYNTVAVVKPDGVDGVVSSIDVGLIGSNADEYATHITVQNNGSAAPTVAVDRLFNYYVNGTDETGTVKIVELGYTVTLDNGRSYYCKLNLNVDSVQIMLSSKIGETVVANGGTYAVGSGEAFLWEVSESQGFAVAVDGVSATENGVASSSLQFTKGERTVTFTSENITSQKTVDVEIVLSVESKSVTFGFTVDITPVQSGAAYTVTNTADSLIFAKNENSVGETGGRYSVQSSWQYNNSVGSPYKYGYSITLTLSNGRFSDYFERLICNGVTINNLNNSSYTLSLVRDNSLDITDGFNIDMRFKTDVAMSAVNTLRVDFVAYNYYNIRWGRSQTVTENYRFRVVDDIVVTLDNNAGGDQVAGGVGSVTVPYKGSYSGLPEVSRPGYEFKGWWTERSGGTKMENGAAMTGNAAHTLYAHWEAAVYTLKYNLNQSSSSSDLTSPTKQVTYGGKYGALYVPEARPGYTFVGWYDARENGNVITENTVVSVTADTVLYAHWTENTYTVTFYRNHNAADTESLGSMLVRYNGTYGLLPTPEARNDGYRFIGWYTSREGGDVIVKGELVDITADTALYAHWEKIEYNIVLELNGGSWVSTAAVCSAKVGENYVGLPASSAVRRDGYTFAGWFTSLNGSTEITSASTFALSNGTTLYARWEAVTFTVTLDPNGGSIGNSTENFVTENIAYNGTFDLHTVLIPTRGGHVFDGWYNGDTRVDSALTDITENITLTAHWKEIYTVTFEYDDGVTENSTATFVQGETYGSKLPVPTRTGYDFGGWFNGGTRVDQDDTVGGNVKLTAKWDIITYTVKFNGGPTAVADKIYNFGDTYGESVNVSGTPETDGRTLKGWSTVENDESKIVASATPVAPEGDGREINLYAIYEPDPSEDIGG